MIEALGISVPAPEVFRRARFNEEDCVAPFVDLLHRMVVRLSHRTPPYSLSAEAVRQCMAAAFPRPGQSDCIRAWPLVRRRLLHIGCPLHLLGLRVEGQWYACSQDLLLVVGWLVAEMGLITAWESASTQLEIAGMVQPNVLPSDIACFVHEPDSGSAPHSPGKASRHWPQGEAITEELVRHRVNSALQKIGKARLELRALISETERLVHRRCRVESAAAGCGDSSYDAKARTKPGGGGSRADGDPLTAFDVYVLRHPEMLQIYSRALETCTSNVVAARTGAAEVDSVWWRWLESIAKEQLLAAGKRRGGNRPRSVQYKEGSRARAMSSRDGATSTAASGRSQQQLMDLLKMAVVNTPRLVRISREWKHG